MFFSVYLGSEAGLSGWRRAVDEHAAWLGASVRVELRRLPDLARLGLAWLETPTAPRRGCILTTTAGEPGTAAPDRPDDNAVSLVVSLRDGGMRITVPPTTPHQCYVLRTAHGHVVGDDLRLCGRLAGGRLDERGVYALLHYGAIPAPLTLYRDVVRIPGGHACTVRATSEPVVMPVFQLPRAQQDPGGPTAGDAVVQDALDATLGAAPRGATLCFSGGVDSGLLAARFASLGRTDITLVNYAFGPEDGESRLARRMAQHLGLPYHEIAHDSRRLGDVLNRLGRDYSYPFGDFSVVPTNLLVHACLPFTAPAHTVIEGTGADGAFGLGAGYPRWRRVYAVPARIRRGAGRAYGFLKLWTRQSRLERLGRVMRKSVQMPLSHAVVVHHALDGIAYAVPGEIGAEVACAIATSIDRLTVGASAEERLSFLDLSLVCAGRMAPKSFDPLRAHGIAAIYPYLEPRMVRASATLSWAQKSTAGEPKALLKRLLAGAVPREWVYRPKSGFTPPYRAIFASDTAQQFLRDVVLAPHNPLLAYCRADIVADLVDGARRQALSFSAYDFLWALTFGSGWLHQVFPAAPSATVAAVAGAAR